MRIEDNLHLSGVQTNNKIMAVGSCGQLIFKISYKSLCLIDTIEHSTTKLSLVLDPLNEHCQIFDVAFSRNGTLILCFSKQTDGQFFVCENERVEIAGVLHGTNIISRKGRREFFLQDEAGWVLVSLPINMSDDSKNYLDLFHCSNFLTASAGSKFRISIDPNGKSYDCMFTHPFISVNHIYLLDLSSMEKIFVIPLSGPNCGRINNLSTSGEIPPRGYLGASIQVFDDYALVYLHQCTDLRKLPRLFSLNLLSLQWSELSLNLSSHFPNACISMMKSSEDTVFLHGSCNVSRCPTKTHLYQINVENLRNGVVTRSRKGSLSSLYCDLTPSPSSKTDLRKSLSDLKVISSSIVNREPSNLRYKKKQAEAKKRFASKTSLETGSSTSSEENIEKIKRANSTTSVHWGADMLDQATNSSLHEQLKLATEWGYDQAEIIAALKSNQKTSGPDFTPFDSVNSMLDVLSQISGRNPKMSALGQGSSRQNDPQRAVTRSSSFHHATSKSSRESHDLTRLLNTLEREKERDREEVRSQFTILRNRIHTLEIEKEDLTCERNDLKRTIEGQAAILVKDREEMAKVLEEKSEASNTVDKLTIECLRHQREIHDQKELAEHRKRLYEDEVAKKDETIQTFRNTCEAAEVEISRLKDLLDEQTKVSRRMEERNSELKPTILLEELVKNHQSFLTYFSKIAPGMNSLVENYEKLFGSYAEMQQNWDKERRDIVEERLQMSDQVEVQRRAYQQLLEKSVAECCICLTNKPSIVFLPCRHLVACQECHSQVTECPTCRSTIEDNLSVYL